MVTQKEREKISRRGRHGVKKHITSYKEDIVDNLYNEKLLEEKLNKYLQTTGQENLNDAFRDYLQSLTGNISKLLKKAKEYLSESYEKGSKSIVDTDGNTVKFDQPADTNAIKVLTQKQQEYYKNLTKTQTTIVNNLIAEGLEKGQPVEQIAKDIKSQVKKTTKASALRIARSEIVSSHSFGQIDTMKKAGVEGYKFINSPDYTGKDGKTYPCKLCRKLQGAKGREYKYEVQSAGDKNNPIPVESSHCNCQCTIVLAD